MNSLIHDELSIIRHTLKVLHDEVEHLRMTVMDLGPDDVDYVMLQTHQELIETGRRIKIYEQSLVRQL